MSLVPDKPRPPIYQIVLALIGLVWGGNMVLGRLFGTSGPLVPEGSTLVYAIGALVGLGLGLAAFGFSCRFLYKHFVE